MSVRMRVTIKSNNDRGQDLRIASEIRRDLWAHSPVEVALDHPLRGIHRDVDGRAYFEFATNDSEQVRRVIKDWLTTWTRWN